MARPTKMTQLTVKKLEEAFALGCSDEEACIYADITKQTLYNFQDKNQEFLDRKTLLKNKPILQARKAILSSFDKYPGLALKFLERRKRDEFDLKQADYGFMPLPRPIDVFGEDDESSA